MAEPSVEELNDFIGAAKRNDGARAKRAVSVSPRTLILDVEPRPVELVALPVSPGVEPYSETGPPVPR